jgi:heat shock protein HslJ
MKKTFCAMLATLALISHASSERPADAPTGSDPKPATEAKATPVADLAKLENTHWRLVDLCGQAQPAEAAITLSFLKEGRIGGRAAVNRYSGGFQIVDGQLKSGPFIMTRMAGPPEAMEREAKYLAALEAAKSVARSASGELLITVADKELPLRFVATDPP